MYYRVIYTDPSIGAAETLLAGSGNLNSVLTYARKKSLEVHYGPPGSVKVVDEDGKLVCRYTGGKRES